PRPPTTPPFPSTTLFRSDTLLGADHPETFTARANLAYSYWSAGRTAEDIPIVEKVVADRERILGPDHPDTLTARANLAVSYGSADRKSTRLNSSHVSISY